MPELPDITVYLEALERRAAGVRLEAVRRGTPFVLRIAIGLENELWLVIHLMVAGRLRWSDRPASLKPRNALAAWDFASGSLLLTEAGSKRRASLHVTTAAGLAAHDPGDLEILEATAAQFAQRLTQSNHTLKRALTDPRLFSGVGNACSDEILHRARLSPVQRIRYASNETNYCPRCQTAGRLLADRALSRLLKKDWPKCVDEL